jgi:hypothetical protein
MPKGAGRSLFIGLIFILLVATFASAMAIPTIGRYWNEYFDSGEEDQDTGKEEDQVNKKNNGKKEKRGKSRFRRRIAIDEEQGDGKSGTPNEAIVTGSERGQAVATKV